MIGQVIRNEKIIHSVEFQLNIKVQLFLRHQNVGLTDDN
jgi:hypothetical protein